jgi:hypothetical protein
MRDLVRSVNRLVSRVREAQAARAGSASDSARMRPLDEIAAKLLTEPVRYGKPGLQAHITYLAGMTTGADQKIGRDAIERLRVLAKELEGLTAEVDRLLGESKQDRRP